MSVSGHFVLPLSPSGFGFYRGDNYLDPEGFLNSAAGSSGAAHTIGNLIIGVDHQVLVEVLPEAMLVLGDTNSCLAVIPAKRRKIPIFHMEAGTRLAERCLGLFEQRWG
ncbi:UDP-N-acetylglucosamine 2-epimerase [Aromatoleum aromaticum]|uniref:Fragment of putative epimerase n=1 Tax=Aromatoleum aromaticum (strain DSM 19018 / LMG 30748 / EbN1) TaxID=76114 RepID=Q5NZL3_AROAE|nr:UDP-N-acetylglucosamine 2-epimerase [Aromatoleum aromaticum]CAI09501.1 fragment of putative epimerase [Aromatoleum aromaticum EbN1]